MQRSTLTSGSFNPRVKWEPVGRCVRCRWFGYFRLRRKPALVQKGMYDIGVYAKVSFGDLVSLECSIRRVAPKGYLRKVSKGTRWVEIQAAK